MTLTLIFDIGWMTLTLIFIMRDNSHTNNFYTHQGGGGARLTGHIQIEGNEDQLRQTLNDIEQRYPIV